MKTRNPLRLFILVLCNILFTLPTHAQVWQGEQKTLPTSFPVDISASASQYGRSVDIDGNYAVVGAYADNDVAINAGAAYVYYYDGTAWQLQKKLTISDGAANDNFGISVAISGTTVVVGAFGDDTPQGIDAGSAYVFSKDQGGIDNWGQVKKLTVADGAAYDNFGYSVAIMGSRIVVGANRDDTPQGVDAGSVYVFEQNIGGVFNWGQAKKLVALDGAANDYFGRSVAIDGTTVVVGADGDDTPLGANSGSAYIFKESQGGVFNWGQVKKLTVADGAAYDNFGVSVDISGTYMVVGASGDDTPQGVDAGSAYVFGQNTGGVFNWGQVKKLIAADGANSDYFGFSVAVSGATVVIGASGDDTPLGVDSGSAYIFNSIEGGANNWGQVKKLTASDGATSNYYGVSVAISSTYILAGSYVNPAAGTNNGAAYFYAQNEGGTNNWGETQKTLPVGSPTFGTASQYGFSVAMDGNYAVVSAHRDDEKAIDAGAAYVLWYNGTNWETIKKLTVADGAANDYFGLAVAINGTTIVVTAHADDTPNGIDSGSAYVFDKDQGGANNWGLVKQLNASDGAAYDWFGNSVTISGDNIVVGAYGDDTPAGVDAGSAYLFSRNQGGTNNWGQVKKITAADAAAGDNFGRSAAINDTIIAVGAYRDDTPAGTDAGSVYLFNKNQGGTNNWGQVKQLTATDGAAEDIFGFAVALSASNLVVGAHGDDNAFGINAGAAYVFGKDVGGTNNWGQVKKLTPTDGGAYDNFGPSVAIAGNNIVIGAYLDDTPAGTDAGSAYVFSKNMGGSGNWGQVEKITPSDGAAVDEFAFSVATNGDFMLIGSVLADEVGTDQGAAYFYTWDVTAPAVSITTATNPTNTSPLATTITFTEEVTSFDVADITVGNGSAANLQTTDNISFTVDITPAAEGTVTIDIAAGVATDLAGNDNIAATQFSITFDSTAPTVAISSAVADPTSSSPFAIDITFSEEVTGFDLADITVSNGSAGNLQTSDNTTFTADITPAADGAVTVDIAAGVATDLAGNANTAASQFTVTYDGTAPTVSISSSEADPTSKATFAIIITFNEAITGFDLADIAVSNGSAGNLQTPDNISFTADIIPAADGAITVDLAAAIATDLAGNANTAAAQFSITFDGTAPMVTLSSSEVDPTPNTPIAVTLTWSEAVTGFTAADLTVGNGAAANLQTSDNITFSVEITPAADGLVTVDLPAGVAQDVAGNDNTAASTFTITFAKILGLNELTRVTELAVYPNPVASELTLLIPSVTVGEYQVRIVDLSGKEWQRQNLVIADKHLPVTMEVSSIPTGTYVLVVQKKEQMFITKIFKK